MPASLAQRRLHAQGLSPARFDSAEAAVAWLGAVQAQDAYGALWAVGSRLRVPRESTVEAAVTQGWIVRTWPMRGTLHFVAAADVRWMLALLAVRVIAANRARLARTMGLDDATLRRSRRVVERALGGGTPVARADLYAALDRAGIATDGQRGMHIVGWLAMQGVVCGGPRAGKQPTFVLLDAWVPPTPPLARDEALHALALRYFRARGPATAQDLAGWAGLTVSDAKRAAALAGDALVTERIDGVDHLRGGDPPRRAARTLHLLAPFDELLVGYRDRAASLDAAALRTVITRNGLVLPAIALDGRVIGTWKRTLGAGDVTLELQPFRPFDGSELTSIRRAAARYAAFLGRTLRLEA